LCVLEATWRLLEATPALEIPVMNCRLVEGDTDPWAIAERLGVIGALGGTSINRS
jgi:hypothetical protein